MVILPTEGCNFRCVYCYEDFAISRMPADVVGGIKRFLSSRFSELTRLDISWFGGEPLLAPDIVLDVLGHIATLRKAYPKTKFSSDITTNAYRLDPSLLDKLVHLGVRSLQITLDGTKRLHDSKRIRADGSGTFGVIWTNLLSMKASKTPFEAILRLHVDQTNREDMIRLLDQCAEEFSEDSRFSFFIRPLSRLGGPHDASLKILGKQEAIDVIAGLKDHAKTLGLQVWLKGEQESMCYAARANSLVIRADGQINKCTVAMRDPRNVVGRLRNDGTVSLDKNAMLPWLRGLWSGRPEELKCPLSGMGTSPSRAKAVRTERKALSRI